MSSETTATPHPAEHNSSVPGDHSPKLSPDEAERVIQSAANKTRALYDSRQEAEKLAAPAKKVLGGLKIDDEAAAKYSEWVKERELAERAAECRRLSAVPERYAKASFKITHMVPDNSHGQYLIAIQRLRELIEKPGLYALCGQIGGGKTHLACALIHEFCALGRSGRYLKTMDYVDRYRQTWGMDSAMAQERFEAQHVRLSLLVLDEWQVRNDTKNEDLILLRLLDKRYDAKRTTLLVSNHESKEEFGDTLDARLADRVQDGGGVILCKWPSIRGLLKDR